ncbi:MAG: flagellar basal body-associated protein FliL [Betaproteobacteria bacterium]|nr:flagellar basal body-associated protein FliL [Betaproteobacteria bacterium]
MANSVTKHSKTAAKTPARQEPDIVAEDAAPPAKKRRSPLKTLLLLTLLLGGAAGAAWFFLEDHEQAVAPAPKPGAAKAATAKPVSSKPPVFVTLEPFTVNLQQEEASPQYLQVGLALKMTDAAFVDAIKLHMPEIRNRVLLLLSGKRASEISTSEGKKTLSTELAREILQPLADSMPAKGLDGVLFTSFVIQ